VVGCLFFSAFGVPPPDDIKGPAGPSRNVSSNSLKSITCKQHTTKTCIPTAQHSKKVIFINSRQKQTFLNEGIHFDKEYAIL
jgi:hypothetical protein